MQASNILDPMIKGLMLTWSRIVFLQEFVINRHHKYIASWIYQVICSIWVNWLYHKCPSHLGWNFSFVLCVITIGLLKAKTRSPFLKFRSLTFLLKALKIWAWYSSICCWACRCLSSKASNSRVAVDASPHPSSSLSKQCVEMGSEFPAGVWLHTRTPKRMV